VENRVKIKGFGQEPERTGESVRKTMKTAIAVREVMDIQQASVYLGIHRDTLYKYAAEGVIPAFRMGKLWRFKRSLLEAWMVEESASAKVIEIKTVKPAEKKPVRRAK